jgi:hypothetical protein
MEATTFRLNFEGSDTAMAGMCAQELRKQILDQVPPGVNIALQQHNPEAMQFAGSELVFHVTSIAIVEAVFKLIEQYLRPPGMRIRLDVGGRVVVLDDVNPKAAKEIHNLLKQGPEAN